MEVCASKKELSGVRGRKPYSSIAAWTPQDIGRRVVSVVAGEHGGLTAYYVKSSIVRVLIEDDHPVVTWGVGVIMNHFF